MRLRHDERQGACGETDIGGVSDCHGIDYSFPYDLWARALLAHHMVLHGNLVPVDLL